MCGPVRVMLMSVFSSRPNLPKAMAFTGDLNLVTDTRCCSLYTRRSPAERHILAQTYPEGGGGVVCVWGGGRVVSGGGGGVRRGCEEGGL